MDRGAWQATVHGVTRGGHNLATKERERALSIIIYEYKRLKYYSMRDPELLRITNP